MINSTSKLATTASFHAVYDMLFTDYRTIRGYVTFSYVWMFSSAACFQDTRYLQNVPFVRNCGGIYYFVKRFCIWDIVVDTRL